MPSLMAAMVKVMAMPAQSSSMVMRSGEAGVPAEERVRGEVERGRLLRALLLGGSTSSSSLSLRRQVVR